MERDGHDARSVVEGVLYAVSVVHVDVDVQHSWVVPVASINAAIL